MSVEAVVAAINKTGVAQVVKVGDGDTKLHLTHRVQKNRLAIWVAILEYVLSRKQGWTVHACKQYFLGESGGVKYAWNFIAQWSDAEQKDVVLHQMATLFLNAAKQVPQISYALDSYPLQGGSEPKNRPEGPLNFQASGYKQKGAHKFRG